MRIYARIISLLVLLSVCKLANCQILGFSDCQNEGDAIIGLDRKGWTTQVSNVSESFQFDFEIPDPPPFDCYEIESIDVSIDLDIQDNMIDSDCFLGFWTHALACDDHDPISCPTSSILYDQQGYNSSFTLADDLTNGMVLGVDLVVLSDAFNAACNQFTISSGDFLADVEVCIEVYYVEKEIDEEIDLGDDIIICPGQTVTIEGPDGFETYVWDGPIDGDEQDLEDAVVGDYILEVFDEEGCRLFDDISVIEDSGFLIEFDLSSPLVLCSDESQLVSSQINGITNNPDFDYSWQFMGSEISNAFSAEVSQAGTYELIVTNEDTDCSLTQEYIVQEVDLAKAQIDSISLDTVTICEGDILELLAFIPFQDNNSYSFEWLIGPDTLRTQSISVNNAGSIILNLFNDLGCPPSSDTIVVQTVSPGNAGEDSQNQLCQTNSIDLGDFLSNDADANGTWTSDDNSILISNGMVNNLTSGNYTFFYIVDNAVPCPPDSSVHQLNLTTDSVDAGPDASTTICNDETIDLTSLVSAMTGGTFQDAQFLDISNTLLGSTELQTGINTYYYIIDSAVCPNDTAEITIELLADINPTIIDDEICEGQSIMIAGNTYDSNNTTDVLILNSVFGCDSIINIDLQLVESVMSDLSQELCTGESLTINGQVFDEAMPSGSVLFPSGSSAGCDSIVNVNLSFVQEIVETINPIICEGEDITINGELFDGGNPGGSQSLTAVSGCDSLLVIQLDILPNSDSLLVVDLCAGESIDINNVTYSESNASGEQMLINANGCDSILMVQVNVLAGSESTVSEILCADETIDIGGVTFDINSTDNSVILSNGNQFGCDSLINVDLTFISIEETTNDYLICEGDSIFIEDEWISDAGSYIDVLSGTNNCDSVIISNVSLEDCNVNLEIDNISAVDCAGDNSGSATIFLSNNATGLTLTVFDEFGNLILEQIIDNDFELDLTDLSAGNYEVQLTDANALIVSDVFNISEPEELSVIVNSSDPSCFDADDGSIGLDVQGGTLPYSFIWNNNATANNLSALTAGTYAYTITDANDCILDGSVELIAPAELAFNVESVDPDCDASMNGSIDINIENGGTGPFQFSLNGAAFQGNSLFTNLPEGNYTIEIQDAESCISSANVVLQNQNDLQVNYLNSLVVMPGESTNYMIESNFNVAEIIWSDVSILSCSDCTDPVITALTSTTLEAELFDDNGCSVMISIDILVEIPQFNDIYLPNILSLNTRDGINNRFMPLVSPQSTIQFESLEIYDRWGNLVFEEQNTISGWDGYYNNQQAESGVYVFVIKYNLAGQAEYVQGQLTVIR